MCDNNAYKVDIDKGYKILRCISPPIILLNSPPAMDKTEFIKKFRDDGYSILSDVSDLSDDKQIKKIHQILTDRKYKNMDHTPLIIDANIINENLIIKIFNDNFNNFTYVFLYPNNSKLYKEHITNYLSNKTSQNLFDNFNQLKLNTIIDLINNILKTDQDNNLKNKLMIEKERDKNITKLTIELIKLSKETYQRHLEMFDNKIFTILI